MGSVPARSGPGVALSVGARPTSCQTLHVAPQRHIRDMGRREATIVGDRDARSPEKPYSRWGLTSGVRAEALMDTASAGG